VATAGVTSTGAIVSTSGQRDGIVNALAYITSTQPMPVFHIDIFSYLCLDSPFVPATS
jgi:hypothetical protein